MTWIPAVRDLPQARVSHRLKLTRVTVRVRWSRSGIVITRARTILRMRDADSDPVRVAGECAFKLPGHLPAQFSPGLGSRRLCVQVIPNTDRPGTRIVWTGLGQTARRDMPRLRYDRMP